MTYEGASYITRCLACESKTKALGTTTIFVGTGEITALRVKCTYQLCKTEWAIYTGVLPNGQEKEFQKRLTTPWAI